MFGTSFRLSLLIFRSFDVEMKSGSFGTQTLNQYTKWTGYSDSLIFVDRWRIWSPCMPITKLRFSYRCIYQLISVTLILTDLFDSPRSRTPNCHNISLSRENRLILELLQSDSPGLCWLSLQHRRNMHLHQFRGFRRDFWQSGLHFWLLASRPDDP